MFVEDLAMEDESVDEDIFAPVHDDSGREYTVGAVVRVAKEGLKAFQVRPDAKGTFNDKKEFVPDKKLKYLVLPVGMRGTVTKVYNINEISANLPVQVKFDPGENNDEGYDPPAPFIMHFEGSELECV
jgi:hypothetical protein